MAILLNVQWLFAHRPSNDISLPAGVRKRKERKKEGKKITAK